MKAYRDAVATGRVFRVMGVLRELRVVEKKSAEAFKDTEGERVSLDARMDCRSLSSRVQFLNEVCGMQSRLDG
jgi:hypothetical protein